jgi:hypothetical protein
MTEILTCRKNGLSSCLAVSDSFWPILGFLWVGIAECGAHVGLWVSSWCFDGVSVMSSGLCLRFRGVVGCGCVVSWFGGS